MIVIKKYIKKDKKFQKFYMKLKMEGNERKFI